MFYKKEISSTFVKCPTHTRYSSRHFEYIISDSHNTIQFIQAQIHTIILQRRLCINAGDLGAIPSLGRSLGEGKGYPLQ